MIAYFPILTRITLYLTLSVWGIFPVLSAITISEHGDLYRVTGVRVDVTAQSAVQAKESAIANGQDIAFQTLLKKILTSNQQRTAASLSSEEFLEDFEIQSQKFSDRRFVATLTYNFNKRSLKNKLGLAGMQPVATTTAPYVIIPILVENDNAKLWDDNPWLRMWANSQVRDSSVPIITPLGDLGDIVVLKPSDAVTLQTTPIERFANKYNAQGAVIAVYRAPDVTVHIVQNGQIATLKVPGIPVLDNKNPDYQQLIPPILTALGRHTKQHPTQQSPQELDVILATKTIRDLIQIQNIFKRINIIDDFTIHNMSIERTQATLKLSGSIPSLRFALQTNGLYLTQGQQGEWWITRTKAS